MREGLRGGRAAWVYFFLFFFPITVALLGVFMGALLGGGLWEDTLFMTIMIAWVSGGMASVWFRKQDSIKRINEHTFKSAPKCVPVRMVMVPFQLVPERNPRQSKSIRAAGAIAPKDRRTSSRLSLISLASLQPYS